MAPCGLPTPKLALNSQQPVCHFLAQAEAGEGAASASEGPAPPVRIQHKLTKKVKFLQKVAASKPPKLAVKKGVAKVGPRPGGKGERAIPP